MKYETISIATETKQQLVRLKTEFGYDTYDAMFKDIIKIINKVIAEGGTDV